MIKKYFLLQSLLMIALALYFEGSVRLDTAEGAIAGAEWLLAHPKHPPLPFWFIEMARLTGAFKYATLYILSYSCMGIGFYFTYKTALLIFDEERAKAAMLYLLCCPILIYAPLQMNHNIALFPLWGSCLYTLARLIYLREWRWLGVSFGLALYAKYAIIMLAVPFGGVMLIHKNWRALVLSPWLIVALTVAILIISPHIYALFTLDNPLFHATKTEGFNLSKRFLDAGVWVGNIILLVLPLLYKREKGNLFSLTAAFGPVLFVLSAVLFFGVSSRPYWVLPMVLCFALLAPKTFSAKFAVIYSSIIFVAFIGVKLFSSHATYSDYDAKATLKLIQTYEKEFGEHPLFISLGAQRGRQLVGSLIFEMKSPKQVLEEGDVKISPWVKTINGATVISTSPLPAHILGREITNKVEKERPLLQRPFIKNKRSRLIYIGKI